MLRTVGWLGSGLVAGFVVATLLPRIVDWENSALDSPRSSSAFDADRDAGLIAARADIEDIRADIDRRLEATNEQLASLAREVEALRTASPTGVQSGPERSLTPDEIAERSEEAKRRFAEVLERQRHALERRETEQLIAAGFSPERIEWIRRRSEELAMERTEAAYQRHREGLPPDPNTLLFLIDPDIALRSDIGDAEYERYLQALGRPTSVNVRRVLAASPSEEAGLRAGDEIVGYAGQRVFSLAEVNALSLQGTPGEPVVLEVRRAGQTMQLVVPRGPLGLVSEPLTLLEIVR